ncbi:hypothetical protein FHS18_003428 [Paenibacillus phyllosphaerae]|uniref:Uncharacterized protein n=1 Tax=Paenibacillus phyllosphaerae TaxID=274593 RepID=A0A7W5AYZ5_9BACL|nr:hypothetical protein [Paenibacillus phyllosphaerae]
MVAGGQGQTDYSQLARYPTFRFTFFSCSPQASDFYTHDLNTAAIWLLFFMHTDGQYAHFVLFF